MPAVRADDGTVHFYFLHMFAGRRRLGDSHFWLEHYFKEFFPQEHYVAHVISVDTAISEQLCNVLGPAFKHITCLANLGVFCLNLAGPPCETRTAARNLDLDTPEPGNDFVERRGPRPLRTMERAWGVHGLVHREVKQLKTGASLMIRSLEVDVRVAAMGGALVMEHPDESPQDSYASIWRTAFHKNYFMKMPFARHHVMVQWRYGAEYVKPTVLRAVNLPRFSFEFASLADPAAQRPQKGKQLGGYDYFGRCFVTSAAKEYPTAMSRALSYASLRCLAARHRDHGCRLVSQRTLPPEALHFLAAVEQASTAFGHEFKPDYQPNL